MLNSPMLPTKVLKRLQYIIFTIAYMQMLILQNIIHTTYISFNNTLHLCIDIYKQKYKSIYYYARLLKLGEFLNTEKYFVEYILL